MLKTAKELIALKLEKTELNKELNNIKEMILDTERKLSELFVENGVSSIGVDKKNVILVEKRSVKCDQSDKLVELLEGLGADVWNKPINTASLNKYVNENPKNIEIIGEHVECTEYYQFQVRKK